MDNILNFARLYKNDVYSDVEFVLRDRDGNRVKIPAHRLVLMVRSSVFERMFYGDLKEDRTVTIVDVSAEAFAEFLQLFYLTKVELTTDNIGEVLKLIDKYDASGLWPVCEAFMDKTLTEVTAYEYYELALSFNLGDDIKNKSEKLLCKNRKLVFGTSDGIKTNVLVLSNILASDELNGKEVDIFNDVMTWAEASLQQRKEAITVESIRMQLGDLQPFIRFPIMTIDNLMECLEKYPSLLPRQEMLEIISFVLNKKPLTLAKHFICEQRKHERKQYVIPLIKTDRYNRGHSDSSITLKWNKPTPVKYSVKMVLFNEIDELFVDNFWVNITKNGTKVDDGHLEVIKDTGNNLGLFELNVPLSFSKLKDTIHLSIVDPTYGVSSGYTEDSGYYISNRYYCYSALSSASSVPSGMSINVSYINLFVREIQLTEVE